MIFRDVLYGEISLPEWVTPFLRLPEFVRLRGVRLSNVDSLQYKDFGSATRYDHALGVVHLALRVAALRRLSQLETIHLVLAALLHDVGTPPFGHTLEIVFDDIDHEMEAWNALGLDSRGQDLGFNAVDGELPQFVSRCLSTSASFGMTIRPDVVGELINGQGDLGFLIKGSIDLDNTDNVLRGAHYMGLDASGELAEAIAHWIATLDQQPSLEGDLPSEALRWINIRDEYYRMFYDCNDEEKGRQALLQFLVRESFRLGLPKERMLKTTDEGLIRVISDYASQYGVQGEILVDAMRKYKRLEPLAKVAEIPLDDKKILDAFRVKASIGWMEYALRQPGFVPMLFMSKRRFPDSLIPKNSLFGYPSGLLSIFALYEPKLDRPGKTIGQYMPDTNELHAKILSYASHKPWREVTERARHDIRESLNAWGDWSFLGSKNDPMHTYPSTYVHTIPSAFIKSLRLAGEPILDPFCGSGVTGIEGAKAGCRVISADVNEIALLITRVKAKFISKENRSRLRNVDREDFERVTPGEKPGIENLYKWHHTKTVDQLTRILGLINQDEFHSEAEFLKLCFSAILTSTTARRGKEHGWFADNTPLAKDEKEPPFIDAYELFLNRIERNLRLLESTYSYFERRREIPEDALSKISVIRANASKSSPSDYGVAPESIGGVITSPPYLCMSDYSLGQRLSYAWLYPGCMERDFIDEIGARRRRGNAEKAVTNYKKNIEDFAKLCNQVLRPGGFVALVMGSPEASKFRDLNILDEVDTIYSNCGFSLLWQTWRPINWHRNHGYERLKKEKLTVFVKQ